MKTYEEERDRRADKYVHGTVGVDSLEIGFRCFKEGADWSRERFEKIIVEKDAKIFRQGVWRCPKCNFRCISQTLYMKSGSVGPNSKPQECSNGCGPLWKVTWEEETKSAEKTSNELFDKLAERDRVIEKLKIRFKTISKMKEARNNRVELYEECLEIADKSLRDLIEWKKTK